ncbi:unnamed protein product [Sphenostylis stenocarpa]|uniref:Secreted protein n=1 Tax=Sphenostylis stenocarpa TaxID=92480 RepID=A0AA86VBE7_9FABA|nr:unnamed protein product [Sphenostylis stenocarpa]
MTFSSRKMLFRVVQLLLMVLFIFVASPESGVACSRPLFLHRHWSREDEVLWQLLPNAPAPPSGVINGSLSQEDPLHSFAGSSVHPRHFCCFSRIWSSLQAIVPALSMVVELWPSFAVPSKRSSTTIRWRSHTSLSPSRSFYTD